MKIWDKKLKVFLILGGLLLHILVQAIIAFYPYPTIPLGDYYFRGLILGVFATIFIMWGCYFWVKEKNRHWVFILWGLLAPVGLLGIVFLNNKEEGRNK